MELLLDMAPKAPVDAPWFRGQFSDGRKTQRGLANALGRHPSAVTMFMQGKRRLTAADLAVLAQYIGAPVSEVMRRAGIESRPAGKDSVAVTGTINEAGEIRAAKGTGPRVPRPPESGDGVSALRYQGEGPEDGWVFYYQASGTVAKEAIGRLSVVQVRGLGTPVLRVVRHGYDSGRFNLIPWDGQKIDLGMENVQLRSASPVLWIRCGT